MWGISPQPKKRLGLMFSLVHTYVNINNFENFRKKIFLSKNKYVTGTLID